MAVARCDFDSAEDCIAAHIAPRVDAQRSPTDKRQWYGRCPLHPSAGRKLSIRIGDHQRIVWQCWKGCAAADVKRALLRAGVSARCVPWKPAGSELDVERLRDLEDMATEIEKIIAGGDAKNVQRLRLLIGMQLWECDRHEAARRLGISQATAYRVKADPPRREQPPP